MYRQYDAQLVSDTLLKEHPSKEENLWSKGWRTNFSKSTNKLGQCSYDEKRIILSLLHLNSASEAEVINTIKHEIAHALAGPGHGHDYVWAEKCEIMGISNVQETVTGSMNVDAARSTKEVEQKAKKKIGQLQKRCPTCNKVAVEINSIRLATGLWIRLKCGHLVKKEALVGEDYREYGSIDGMLKAFNYQIEGIDFIIKNNGRVLIADEPGLGKTIQAIGFLKYFSSISTPCLWVCKSTLTLQACKEFLIWSGPQFYPQVIVSSGTFIIPGMKVYVISMDLLRRMPKEKIEKMGIKCIIADEVQHFKNPDSSRTAELRLLVNNADFFIALSGTPWKNRSSEYFTILNMLAPEKFPSKQAFINKWIDFEYDPKSGKTKEAGIRNIKEFREFTSNIVLRRMRDDVLPDLPKIYQQVRFVDMDKYQEIYDKEESSIAAAIKDSILDGRPIANLAGEIMRLKHITGIAKAASIAEDAIEYLNDTGEENKITIGYHHEDVGNIIQNGDPLSKEMVGLDKWLVENGYESSLRIDGSSRNRDDIVQEFKNNPKRRVLLLSTLAGGEGLNLQFCQNVMQGERQWNRANEEQFEFRFSRPLNYGDYPKYLQEHLFEENKIAKKVSIRIPYFIAADTIDEMLTDIVARKEVNYRKTMNMKDEGLKYEDNDIIRELAEMIVKKRYKKVA